MPSIDCDSPVNEWMNKKMKIHKENSADIVRLTESENWHRALATFLLDFHSASAPSSSYSHVQKSITLKFPSSTVSTQYACVPRNRYWFGVVESIGFWSGRSTAYRRGDNKSLASVLSWILDMCLMHLKSYAIRKYWRDLCLRLFSVDESRIDRVGWSTMLNSIC